MSVVQRSAALIRMAVAAVVVAALSSDLLAQQPQNVEQRAPRVANTVPQPTPDTTSDAWVNAQGQSDDNSPKRYDEPPPPPFDYWQPTWMPCQSLRVNRSLVLGHLYWGMDILGWSTKGVHVPALVTTSSLADAGVIGNPSTVIRFGGDSEHDTMRPGGRLTFGWWFDPNQYSAVEWNYFELDGKNYRLSDSVTDGSSVIARPFIDTTGTNQADPTANDIRSGSIRAASDFQLTSMEIIYRKLFWASDTARFDYLIGYRHTHLADRIRTDENFTVGAGDPVFNDGDTIHRVDQFRTINQFDGMDLGIKGWWSRTGCLALTGFAKTAIGATNNTVLNNGFTATTVNRTTTTVPGGVLTQPSNIGRQSLQEFGTVTEVGLGLQWRPGCYWKFDLGYTWLYWNQVARAGDQINTTVDTTQATNNPAFLFHTTSFWAQGINGGFTYQF
jgi:hypothetical protein